MMMDVENGLRPGGSSRVRCVDVFLVVSVVVLFAAVGVLGVALFLGMKADGKAEPLPPSARREDPTSQQNFAFLQVDSNKLKTGTMTWSVVSQGEGSSVGSLFHFNPAHHTIQATRHGHYFIYIALKLTCTSSCSAGRFTVSIGDHLSCTFELEQWEKTTPVYRKCWGVAKLVDTDRLITQMTVPTKLDEWTIDVAASEQGLYRLD